MRSYGDRFVKIEIVFHAIYFENEVGDPPIFGVSDKGNLLSNSPKSMEKICVAEVFRANALKGRIEETTEEAVLVEQILVMNFSNKQRNI